MLTWGADRDDADSLCVDVDCDDGDVDVDVDVVYADANDDVDVDDDLLVRAQPHPMLASRPGPLKSLLALALAFARALVLVFARALVLALADALGGRLGRLLWLQVGPTPLFRDLVRRCRDADELPRYRLAFPQHVERATPRLRETSARRHCWSNLTEWKME